MRKFVIELDDTELAQLEAAAHALHTDPAAMVKAHLLEAIQQSAKERDEVIAPWDDSPEAKRARRHARLLALSASSGIWPGERDKPKDGLVYQEDLRAEWP